jgi:hypothetical protein
VSRYVHNAIRDEDLFDAARFAFLVEITPGAESDWELFERRRTTPVEKRLRIAGRWAARGYNIGVRGEPFIPGYHTTDQFRDMLKRLRSHGLTSYNTYNLHMNELTLQRMNDAGLDIERIWKHNQDQRWRPIQQKLCQIAEEEKITLGCPDFVNVPSGWESSTNTCCGVSVPNPLSFNTHQWRTEYLDGSTPEEILDNTWEGIGTEEDRETAWAILSGRSNEFYTMKDMA